MTRRIDISWKTIIFVTGFLLALWVTYLIMDIILLVFVAFIFMSALAPVVSTLTYLKLPKPLAILVSFIVIFGFLIGMIAIGFTPIITQTSNLSQRLSDAVAALTQANYLDQNLVHQEITNLSHQALGFTLSAFASFVSLVSVIVITFYMLMDREHMEHRAASLFIGHEVKVKKLIASIEEKLGAWLRGQLILSLAVGVVTYLGLILMGIEYALPLAIIAGLLEVVPVIGPIVSAIPAILVALTVSPLLAALVVGFYLAVQQVESHVLVPQIMKRAVGLNPLLVIIAIAIGSRLLDISGALLAVPIAVVLQIVAKEVLNLNEQLADS
jgi:predicted PurR-regulated permease PerM